MKDLSQENLGRPANRCQENGQDAKPRCAIWVIRYSADDDFWMVRCAIIQALEMIETIRAIKVLEKVADQDSYQVVRSYAAKAIERLS